MIWQWLWYEYDYGMTVTMEVFCKDGLLKIVTKFTGKHLR